MIFFFLLIAKLVWILEKSTRRIIFEKQSVTKKSHLDQMRHSQNRIKALSLRTEVPKIKFYIDFIINRLGKFAGFDPC